MQKRTLVTMSFLALALIGGAAVLAQRPGPVDPPPPADVAPAPPALIPGGAALPPPEAVMPGNANLPPAGNIPPAAGVADDDPMKNVEAFVERSRKETEDSINALTREAETLRARLQKVEAALRRWKLVEAALKQEHAADLAPAPVVQEPYHKAEPPLPSEPTDLSPAPIEKSPSARPDIEPDAGASRLPLPSEPRK